MPSSLRINRTANGVETVLVPNLWLDGEFAMWLRHAMAERGITNRMLGLRSGVDHSTISRLLKGSREPSLRTALALLGVLGTGPVRFETEVLAEVG